MAELQRAVATLRISSDDLDPDEISALLGAEPTQVQTKGQEIPSKKPGNKSRVAHFGMWRLRASETSPENLDGQVSELVGQLTQDLGIWRKIREKHNVDLFCGWFMGERNEGVAISPETLRALGERGIQLSLDIYAPDRDG